MTDLGHYSDLIDKLTQLGWTITSIRPKTVDGVLSYDVTAKDPAGDTTKMSGQTQESALYSLYDMAQRLRFIRDINTYVTANVHTGSEAHPLPAGSGTARPYTYPTVEDLVAIARVVHEGPRLSKHAGSFFAAALDEVHRTRTAKEGTPFLVAANLMRAVQKHSADSGTALVAGAMFLEANGYPDFMDRVDDVSVAHALNDLRVGGSVEKLAEVLGENYDDFAQELAAIREMIPRATAQQRVYLTNILRYVEDSYRSFPDRARQYLDAVRPWIREAGVENYWDPDPNEAAETLARHGLPPETAIEPGHLHMMNRGGYNFGTTPIEDRYNPGFTLWMGGRPRDGVLEVPNPYKGERGDHSVPHLYDPELGEVVPHQVFPDKGNTVVPRKDTEWRQPNELGLEREPGYMWRGMSAEEYADMLRNGEIRSKGIYNIGDNQKGHTLFGLNPGTGFSYADGFAPSGFKPTFHHPGYVVRARIPDWAIQDGHVAPSGEVAVSHVPLDHVDRVFEGRPYQMRPGYAEYRKDLHGYNGKYQMGGASGIQSNALWREVPAPHLAKVSNDTWIYTDEPEPEGDPDYKFVYYRGGINVKPYDHNLRAADLLAELLGAHNKDIADYDVSDADIVSGTIKGDTDMQIEFDSLNDPDLHEKATTAIHDWKATNDHA